MSRSFKRFDFESGYKPKTNRFFKRLEHKRARNTDVVSRNHGDYKHIDHPMLFDEMRKIGVNKGGGRK